MQFNNEREEMEWLVESLKDEPSMKVEYIKCKLMLVMVKRIAGVEVELEKINERAEKKAVLE